MRGKSIVGLLLVLNLVALSQSARDRFTRNNNNDDRRDYHGKKRQQSRIFRNQYLQNSVQLPSNAEDKHTEFVKGKICIGTKSRLSVPSNREHHYRNLRDRFKNCTYVDGNLELTWLQNQTASVDLSFLENIREVTGYVLVSHVDVKNVILPRLQIIRGRTLLPINGVQHALFVSNSKMYTLEMPALRDILQGSVSFHNNFNLCHIKSINWNEIISDPKYKFQFKYEFQSPERKCPKCNETCEDGCWGEGVHNCQQFNKINCSPQCSTGRCFGPQPRHCCHSFCAGGCTGPTQKDCIACKNFYDDGVCKEECPPMQRYNPTNYLWEHNPEGKFAYGATCVKNCPEHLLKDNGACVRSCPIDKMAKNGECVPCNGPCPKTCSGVSVVHSGNIDSFRGCTVIEGSVRILDQTFSGFQDVFNNNYTLGMRYIAMHPDRLAVFSSVKEITGYLDVQAVHEDFKNLSYFRNLEIIHGRQLMENYFAAFSVVQSSLHSLDLMNLKSINSGSIVIQHNKNMCFVDEIAWAKIQKSVGHGVVIAKNRNPQECRNDGLICSDVCNSAGCWGAQPDQCLECKNFEFNGTCIADCKQISYTYQHDSKICKVCHPECKTCTGPGADQCGECVHVRDEQHCVSSCPDQKFNDGGVCKTCHETCEGCSGPRNTIGPGGCNTCNLAIINSDASVERCLKKNDKCPDGYYWEYVNPQEQGYLKPMAGKAICRKCHPRCELCTGYGFHEQVCAKCTGYKRGEQCEDECQPDDYADVEKRECIDCHSECKGCNGPTSRDCLQCRNFKVFGDADPFDNSTIFNCTEKCPLEYPHIIFQSPEIGPYCSASPASVPWLAATDDFPTVVLFALVVGGITLAILALIAYYCRQTAKEKKETAKMTSLVLSGLDDSQPLRPSNIGPNLTKLRHVKEADLKKFGPLGMGAFGQVFKGIWRPEGENVKIPVAIKELHKVNGSESSKEFLEEAYIMASVDHPHLLKLLAVCMASKMMLITQLMPLGCLLDYVKNNKDIIGSKALLNWSTQIAKGMAYLEERRLVHRDLAARNVLMQKPSFVKIADFGLAKLLNHETDEYKAPGGKMPIKWLALECIRHRVFTSKSDVWAFAVTIWELLSFGGRPYDKILAKDIPNELEGGLKLEQPEICSLDVYITLMSCWQLEAELRPSFKELVTIFAEYAQDPGRYLVIPGDNLTRLPSYTSQDEKDAIRRLAPTFDSQDTIIETEDYLQPKTSQPGPSGHSNGMLKLNRYCKDPMNKTSSGDDETDSAREVGVGNLRLDLPVDEDDYLMPTYQKTNSLTHLNHNNNNGTAPSGYMDLIGVPASIDNPEYLMNPQLLGGADAPIPTQTLGIPVMQQSTHSLSPTEGEQTSSDHEYYNDLQRELQPLHRSETRV